MRKFTRLLLAIAPLSAAALPAQPVVSPADRATLEGSSSSIYPLGRFNCRLQQLHSDLGAAPFAIAGHAYRRDATATQGEVASYRVELAVALSISPRTPATASRTFSENEGAAVTVLPQTWVDFPKTQRPSQAPAPTFELRVPYAAAFAYPGGGAVVCLDTSVYGNDGPNGINANFTPYQDAHEQFPDGRNLQPGFRYGAGCAAPGNTAPATASFELRHFPGGRMELDIQARNGMPTDPTGSGLSALLVGFRKATLSWPARPACTLLTSTEAWFELPGANDPNGHWNGMLQSATPLPIGMEFYAQVASGHALNGVAISDASHVVVPPLGPVPMTVARIANGSDRTAPTGTVSNVVPVTELF